MGVKVDSKIVKKQIQLYYQKIALARRIMGEEKKPSILNCQARESASNGQALQQWEKDLVTLP